MDPASQRRDAARLDADRALHARLLRRDPIATSDLAVTHLEPLIGWLGRTFPNVDADLLGDVADWLILDVAERPEQYDPSRLGLEAYLHMAARGDVWNALKRARRRAIRHVPLDAVELSQRARNSSVEGPPDPADVVAAADAVDAEVLAAFRPHFDDVEWEIVQLDAEGERRTAVFAELLGLGDRPEIEQRREVKRVKDRLKKRLQRLAPTVRRDD